MHYPIHLLPSISPGALSTFDYEEVSSASLHRKQGLAKEVMSFGFLCRFWLPGARRPNCEDRTEDIMRASPLPDRSSAQHTSLRAASNLHIRETPIAITTTGALPSSLFGYNSMADRGQGAPQPGGGGRRGNRPSSFGLQQVLGNLSNLNEENLARVDAFVERLVEPPMDSPDSRPSARFFSVYVKVDSKDSMETEHKWPCGQEALRVNSAWDYHTLCTFLKTKWQDLQNGPIAKRVNLGPRAHWSDLHRVVQITVGLSQDGGAWCADPIEPMAITEDNCAEMLDLLKDVKVPAITVLIAPPLEST